MEIAMPPYSQDTIDRQAAFEDRIAEREQLQRFDTIGPCMSEQTPSPPTAGAPDAYLVDGPMAAPAEGASIHAGISRLHAVKVTKAIPEVGTAYVGQALFWHGGKLYGGTLCDVRGEGADELAASIAEAWNERAERLKGGAA